MTYIMYMCMLAYLAHVQSPVQDRNLKLGTIWKNLEKDIIGAYFY